MMTMLATSSTIHALLSQFVSDFIVSFQFPGAKCTKTD